MKTFICCLFFPFYYSISYAQNYIPFPTANAIWYESYGWNGGTFSYLGVEYKYLNGDTTINSLLYHKIYSEGGIIYNPWPLGFPPPPPFIVPPVFAGSGGYNGAIREDSSKHVFFFPANQNPPIHEYLLYDFNLHVGDTLSDTLYNIQNPFVKIVVNSIDSIFDGFVFRKTYNLNSSIYYASIIEGIGNTRGLTYSLLPFFEDWAGLICFSENNIPKFNNLDYNFCSLTGIGEINPTDKTLFNLSPNPTTEILNIKSKQPILFPLQLFVMDMQGKLITQKIIYNNDDLSLNVKTLENGAYLIAIKNKECVLFHGIFSKQ